MIAKLTHRLKDWRSAGRQIPLKWWLVVIFSVATLAIGAGLVLWQVQRRAALRLTAGVFARELSAAQTDLHTTEIVMRLELLRSFLAARRTQAEIESLFEAISRTAERTYEATDPRWAELEAKLTSLGLDIANSDNGADSTIDELIALLAP